MKWRKKTVIFITTINNTNWNVVFKLIVFVFYVRVSCLYMISTCASVSITKYPYQCSCGRSGFFLGLFWAMSKISAVWVDSTLLCNTSVISFLPIIYVHCVQQAANSSLRNSFLINLLLVVLDCAVPVVSTYGCLHCYFNFVTSLIQPAFPKFPLFSFILWICLFMTFIFLFP